jgi:hypothetical protein
MVEPAASGNVFGIFCGKFLIEFFSTYMHAWKNIFFLPWRCGIVVIVSAYRTEDPGIKFRQGVRFIGIITLQRCCHN